LGAALGGALVGAWAGEFLGFRTRTRERQRAARAHIYEHELRTFHDAVNRQCDIAAQSGHLYGTNKEMGRDLSTLFKATVVAGPDDVAWIKPCQTYWDAIDGVVGEFAAAVNELPGEEADGLYSEFVVKQRAAWDGLNKRLGLYDQWLLGKLTGHASAGTPKKAPPVQWPPVVPAP